MPAVNGRFLVRFARGGRILSYARLEERSSYGAAWMGALEPQSSRTSSGAETGHDRASKRGAAAPSRLDSFNGGSSMVERISTHVLKSHIAFCWNLKL